MKAFSKTTITADSARRIIEAGEKAAEDSALALVFAVCDESGVLKAFSRMDGAPLISVQVAQDKAYTAAGFGMPTHQWHDIIKDDGPLRDGAVGGIDRLIVFAGGLPIVADGAVIGGFGVSGGHYSQDLEVAEAALKAFEVLAEQSPATSPR